MFDIKYCDYSEYYERPKYGQSNIIYEKINIFCFKFQMRRIQFPPKKIFTKSEKVLEQRRKQLEVIRKVRWYQQQQKLIIDNDKSGVKRRRKHAQTQCIHVHNEHRN